MKDLKVARLVNDRTLNLSYLVWARGQAAAIDPSFLGVKLMRMVAEKGMELRYVLNTHGHSDHASTNGLLRKELGGKLAIHVYDSAMIPDEPDILLRGDERLPLGGTSIHVIHTPGHTPGSVCFLVEGALFTGDTLFVGGWGRTDLQGGSDRDLYESMQVLKALDDETKVYPGHAYGGLESNMGREKATNPALLASSFEEFLSLL